MDQRTEFQELVLTTLDSCYSYARVLAASPAEAEDLLQETLLRAYRGFASFNRDLSFKVWAFRIMRNAHIDRLRRRRGHPPAPDAPWESLLTGHHAEDALLRPAPMNPEEILERRLAIEDVRAAIHRLPGPLREVVELREIEGMSYQEIATVIQVPVGTVMSRLFRGRNLLRSLLHEHAPAAAIKGTNGL